MWHPNGISALLPGDGPGFRRAFRPGLDSSRQDGRGDHPDHRLAPTPVRRVPLHRLMRLPALRLGVLLFGCARVEPDPPRSLAGHWVGQADEGGSSIPIALDFAEASGALTGNMSLPTERLLGKPLSDVAAHADAV